jgi:UPF0755 protein
MKSVILFIFLCLGILFFILTFPYTKDEKNIYIQKGQTIETISENLKREKIVISKDFLKLLFLLFENPKAGFYKIDKNSSLIDVFSQISKGKQKLVKVIIVPGDDLFSISQKLEKKGVISQTKFLGFFNNKFKLLSVGFVYDNFEGFIVPDTYFIEKNISAYKLFNLFYNRFIDTYKVPNKNFYQKMIIASIIEKEAKTKKDKYLISSVIHNRLAKKIPLQIDATLIYMAKKLNLENKSIKQLKQIHSPYNTYKVFGLPPTPIGSFSKESLEAALNPEKTNYLFYFTKDGQNHIFSETYKEHIKKLKSK